MQIVKQFSIRQPWGYPISILLSTIAVMILASPCFASEDYNNAVRIERQYCERTALVVYKPVTVYREIYYRQWETPAECEQWYLEQGFTKLFPNGGHVDCDDYEKQVRVEALRQGYSVSTLFTWYGKIYNGQYVTDKWSQRAPGHVVCGV